jgi:multidrug transporter EmrE-like cation transporter
MTYVFVLATVGLGLYGQLILKWQMSQLGPAPHALPELLPYLLKALLNPWVLSSIASAFLGMVTWMAAVSRLPLSQAYPFVSLSFPLILVCSWLAFGEPITVAKAAGVGLIMAGLIVGHL